MFKAFIVGFFTGFVLIMYALYKVHEREKLVEEQTNQAKRQMNEQFDKHLKNVIQNIFADVIKEYGKPHHAVTVDSQHIIKKVGWRMNNDLICWFTVDKQYIIGQTTQNDIDCIMADLNEFLEHNYCYVDKSCYWITDTMGLMQKPLFSIYKIEEQLNLFVVYAKMKEYTNKAVQYEQQVNFKNDEF